ncbi:MULTISPECIES: AAA family ATPase [Pseudomonas aeruginosa group]|uniref:AAA family ATPase n=1 Tax=Pseudomonas aeruginosa group TaxID=136841 RepID=UPI002271933B|nr:AAA family ATPase [Pseudomonas aeruginosa]MCY0334079.1 AAA family ATPase [Pseudomonas aeruginosa]MCY0352419.1 AAA family ATPase [Pseudomonas aeruginosa]
MIKGIMKIKGLGVYENYTKPIGTPEFGIKNLIYGWNYSGKTTLSRLFAQLEAKKPNPDLSGCEFSFETDTQTITEKNFEQSNLMVRVFNSDFIRENLHFEGNNFSPILLLGKESEEAQKKIDHKLNRIKKSGEARKLIESQITAHTQAVASAKTEAAKNIRQLLKVDPYTATQLSTDITAVGILDSQLLSESDLSDNLELALTPDNNKPSTVDRVSATPSIRNIHKEAITILATTPTFSNTLKHLEENLEIERWIETGLHIHPQEGTCEFCGSIISESRLAQFRAHFSKDLADHKKKVEDLLQRVKATKIQLTLPKEVELNTQFRERYSLAAEPLPQAIDLFNQAVESLINDVQLKLDAPRKLMTPKPLTEGLAEDIISSVEIINAVIDENNKLADNFTTVKKEAVKRVKYHYVQQFIDSQANIGHEQKKSLLAKRKERLQTFSSALQGEVAELQAQISKAQLGREKINERLTSMLGSDAIQIVVINDQTSNQERFKLVRKGGKAARNLSDGERTAIAFSYFLTKLQELRQEDFAKTVVYIDDPISSLDANHIFQVTAAIRAIFFKQENENAPWTTTCNQIFISTHNFEFFNLLREIKPEGPKQGARLYLIKRINEKSSTFCDMPASLARYQSEYHFLFDVIYRFHQAPDKTDHAVLMLLPNAMRRFIELYTYSRLPGVMKETVDQRAEALFGAERSKRILKIFHYFSHANTIDRLAGNNELIFNTEHAIKDLIDAITQTDKQHMDALIASIQA